MHTNTLLNWGVFLYICPTSLKQLCGAPLSHYLKITINKIKIYLSAVHREAPQERSGGDGGNRTLV